MTSENQKSPFIVVTKITTYTESNHPLGITEYVIRANTRKELESRMGRSKAEIYSQSAKSGKRITISFGPELELNMETGKYDPLQEVKEKRGMFSRILEGVSPTISSASAKDEEE